MLCYNKSCRNYNKEYAGNCQHHVSTILDTCVSFLKEPPEPLPKQLIELDKQSVKELSIIILRLALEEHDERFTL